VSADTPKPTALSPEDARLVDEAERLFYYEPDSDLVRIIRDLDARLVAATMHHGREGRCEVCKDCNCAISEIAERAEKAEARVAELEAKFVKWAPIISGRCGRCGLHDGHHTISCGIRK